MAHFVGFEGLLNLLPLWAEGFSDFAKILAFGGKKHRLLKVVKATPLTSAVFLIRICLDSFLPSLSAESTVFRIWQIQKDQSNTPYIVRWVCVIYQYNFAKNGKGLKISTKEADTILCSY